MASSVRLGGALAVLGITMIMTGSGRALAQQQSAPQPAPKPALPGAPWAQPVIPRSLSKAPLSPEKLRPSERNLIDCKDAPAAAVTTMPEPVARWATIYCTKFGHILTTNERYYSAVPGTNGNARGVLSAADLSGRKGELGHGAHFTKIDYAPLSKPAAQQATAGADPALLKIVKNKPLFRLDVTVDTGQTSRALVVDPTKDPFWVLPLVNGKLGRAGFYVATPDYVNRARTQ
jgi:hypothetical protein